MRIAFTALIVALGSICAAQNAFAGDTYEAQTNRLNDEIANLPEEVGAAFLVYSNDLKSNSENISNLQVANCSSVSDFTLELLMQSDQQVDVDTLNLQYLKSRAWTSLYLSRASSGVDMPTDTLAAELDAAKGGVEIGNLIQSKNTDCNGVLSDAAGAFKLGASE